MRYQPQKICEICEICEICGSKVAIPARKYAQPGIISAFVKYRNQNDSEM
jgi:hypothetical protein